MFASLIIKKTIIIEIKFFCLLFTKNIFLTPYSDEIKPKFF